MNYHVGTAAFAASVFLASAAVAEEAEDAVGEQPGDESRLEIVMVTGVRMSDDLVIETSKVSRLAVDNSDLLRQFPGGNRNANGPLTRISQYRGLYGSQNNVDIDGLGYSSDCPNWMDTPLSSIPQSLTQSVTLFRGLGSVDTIQEGLGGGIHITSRNGSFTDNDDWTAFGNAEAGYGGNASSWNASFFAGFNNRTNWLNMAASHDEGDDYQYDGGVVAATEYERDQFRFGYGRLIGETELSLAAVINRTDASGTPALPMDIRYIDSQQYSIDLETPAGPGQLVARFSTLSVDHVMDNFTLRPPPVNAMGKPSFRESSPFGDAQTMKVAYEMMAKGINLVFGTDGKWDSHTAEINDPTKPPFFILNFNDVKRDRIGFYGMATGSAGTWDIEGGVRYNQVRMNAGDVSGNLAMMAPPGVPVTQQDRLDELADDFNAADRKKRDHQWSAIFKTSHAFSDTTRLNLGLGRKVRSPSYQERYLWLPMEATAGLADGRTYIGDINLKPEKSIEVTAGLDWNTERFTVTPELFYRHVNDYIQGVPSTNTTANMFAIIATGQPPLQYANVDAELYGADLGYEWEISGDWLLRGNFSYVRGKRTDVKDNLYRIAPLSAFSELMYVRERYFVSAEGVAAAKQDKVAAYDNEQTSSGWGIVNLRAGVELGKAFNLGFGVENVFDKAYQDHLAGYNRVRGSDVPVGERLYSKGRNFYIKLNANW